MSIAPHRPIAAAPFLTVLTGSAAALPLPPGGEVSGYWNYETYVAAAVAADDPAFFGTPGPTASGSATVIRDGLDPGSNEPVEDLFVATGTIQTSVTLSGAGRTVFQYDFDVDPTNAGPSGLAFATVSGLAGYGLDVVQVSQPSDLYFYPEIRRSADGDTVRFDFAVDEPFSEGLDGMNIEPVLIATDAPSFRGGGRRDGRPVDRHLRRHRGKHLPRPPRPGAHSPARRPAAPRARPRRARARRAAPQGLNARA